MLDLVSTWRQGRKTPTIRKEREREAVARAVVKKEVCIQYRRERDDVDA
jgi:hypothetical protein